MKIAKEFIDYAPKGIDITKIVNADYTPTPDKVNKLAKEIKSVIGAKEVENFVRRYPNSIVSSVVDELSIEPLVACYSKDNSELTKLNEEENK